MSMLRQVDPLGCYDVVQLKSESMTLNVPFDFLSGFQLDGDPVSCSPELTAELRSAKREVLALLMWSSDQHLVEFFPFCKSSTARCCCTCCCRWCRCFCRCCRCRCRRRLTASSPKLHCCRHLASARHAVTVVNVLHSRGQERDARLRFDKQPSFELGVVSYIVCARSLPVHRQGGVTADDLPPLPEEYPSEFTALLPSLVAVDPGKARVDTPKSRQTQCHCYHHCHCHRHCHCHCRCSVAERTGIAEANASIEHMFSKYFDAVAEHEALCSALTAATSELVRIGRLFTS